MRSYILASGQMIRFLRYSSKYHKKHYRWVHSVKQSYAFTPGDIPLLGTTMGQLVDAAADAVGDSVAFVSCEQNIRKTFLDFKNDVDKLASGLLSFNLQKGDRIAIYAPNCYEWPVTQFAAAKAGLILVNINPSFKDEELKYCLNKVDCKAIVSFDCHKKQDFYSIMRSLIPELSNCKPGCLRSAEIRNLETVIFITKKKFPGTATFDEVLTAGDSRTDKLLQDIEKNMEFDDPVNIQFTSGTTGYPKAATLTHHNIVNNVNFVGRRLGFHLKKPTVCCQVPLFHCFGCVLGTLGSVFFQNMCILPSLSYNAKASIKAIETERCSHIYGTPTMFIDVMSEYNPDLNDLRFLTTGVIGGASCPEHTVKEIKEKLKLKYILNAYGMTENSPGVAVTKLSDTHADVCKQRCAALEQVELKIVNSSGQIVPIGVEGELYTRGYNQFMGYWNAEDDTKEAVDHNHWYHTGDLAVMDENSYIRISGRKRDLIIRGGENIYPLEIEDLLHNHPAIEEAHVIGVPDVRMGEELCAWVKLKDGENLSIEDIKLHFKGKVSHFKIPRYIVFVKDFPKTTSGKIQKFKMKEISTKELNLS